MQLPTDYGSLDDDDNHHHYHPTCLAHPPSQLYSPQPATVSTVVLKVQLLKVHLFNNCTESLTRIGKHGCLDILASTCSSVVHGLNTVVIQVLECLLTCSILIITYLNNHKLVTKFLLTQTLAGIYKPSVS
jgi:hypothetical protein